jgi:glycosyltransferase involved in cell wall biosynthesis
MTSRLVTEADVTLPAGQRGSAPLRVAINLLTEDPHHPSGAHWFWTRVIPEMSARLGRHEELHLLVSPASRHLYGDYGSPGDGVRFITFPWSNERRNLRTLGEHLYSPLRLPLSRIDVLNTLMAPIVNPTWSLVIHMKTMHAYTSPDAIGWSARTYRRMSYPRSARLADAIIINSNSIRSEIEEHLDVDTSKLRLIYEAVDHSVFSPGDAELARSRVAAHGVVKPFALFVSSLWPYKNCHGLLQGWAEARIRLPGRQLAIVGGGKDDRYRAHLSKLVSELGLADEVVFVGSVSLEETVNFYRAAEVFVYPSLNETFGLPILEAMACGCPVVTSSVSAMPEIAGGAATLCDPTSPASIAEAIVQGARAGERLREAGLRRAAQFTWGATAAATLDVYREVGDRRRARSRR